MPTAAPMLPTSSIRSEHFHAIPRRALAWVATIQALQDPAGGLFHEPTHHEIHTTAHCLAALELFDAAPLHQVSALHDLLNVQRMESFLEILDWGRDPWRASHQGAGLYVCVVLTGAASLAWQDRYFSWLWVNSDPSSGFLRRGYVAPVPHGDIVSIFPHLAGSFHYFFNHVYARRPWRYPAATVDSCLDIATGAGYPLGERVSFAEVDWVFCLARSLQQSGHRFGEARAALLAFADRYLPFLISRSDADLDDLHALFGAVCCLAELQQAIPGLLRSEHPLKQVLDRRPFI